MIITVSVFESLVAQTNVDMSSETSVAVAVSGGGDSLALSVLLVDWCAARGVKLHALTVDHGLRPEAAAEAKYVGKTLKPLGAIHKTLKWDADKPSTRIQEAARDARYALMGDYCRQHKIRYLFVAHHGQDQMETLLFRMAKGTGVDGLVGIRPVQELDNGLVLLRPLLSVAHGDLLDVLKERNMEWIEDESNQNNRYARVRIRNTIGNLEKEGLSPERVNALTSRVAQSIDLIDYLIEDKYKSIATYNDTKRIEIIHSSFLDLPIDGKIRILRKIIGDLHPTKKYPARLEDIERLAARMGENFRGATLGGCIFQKKKDGLIITLESI